MNITIAVLVQNANPDFAFDKVIARLTGFDESGAVIGKPAFVELYAIGNTLRPKSLHE